MILALVAVLLRPSLPAAVFGAWTCAHYLLAATLNDPLYYFSASLFDLACIETLDNTSRKALELKILSAFSLCANAIGWAFWASYRDPGVYNDAMLVIYIAAAFIILKEGRGRWTPRRPYTLSGTLWASRHLPRGRFSQ